MWAGESDQELVVILLDVAKAYDKPSWTYLEERLCKKRFAEVWIKWIKATYLEATTEVPINRINIDPFQIERSVRQGCPLAPYLFILAADVLGKMLDNEVYGVQRLSLPMGHYITSQTFADDTALYLKGTIENVIAAMDMVEAYCQASGSK